MISNSIRPASESTSSSGCKNTCESGVQGKGGDEPPMVAPVVDDTCDLTLFLSIDVRLECDEGQDDPTKFMVMVPPIEPIQE